MQLATLGILAAALAVMFALSYGVYKALSID